MTDLVKAGRKDILTQFKELIAYGQNVDGIYYVSEFHITKLIEDLEQKDRQIIEKDKEIELAHKLIGYDLYSNRKKRGATLWSDKNPYNPETCEMFAEARAVYNLYEDILCLKEDIVELKDTIKQQGG